MIQNKVNFQTKNYVEYQRILEVTTKHLAENYSEVILEIFGENKENAKKIILDKISIFLEDRNIACENYEYEELCNKLYIDSFEFQFLNKYIFDDKVEEINGNSWDCIFVNYSDGRVEKIEESFESPQVARDVVSRILRVSNKRVDNNQPIALGEIGKNKRITVMIPPVIDEDAGVSFSLRNVHSNKVNKDMFLNSGSVTNEILNISENVIITNENVYSTLENNMGLSYLGNKTYARAGRNENSLYKIKNINLSIINQKIGSGTQNFTANVGYTFVFPIKIFNYKKEMEVDMKVKAKYTGKF